MDRAVPNSCNIYSVSHDLRIRNRLLYPPLVSTDPGGFLCIRVCLKIHHRPALKLQLSNNFLQLLGRIYQFSHLH